MSFTPPVFNLTCNVFATTDGVTPIQPAFFSGKACNARSPRDDETAPITEAGAVAGSVVLVVGFPIGTNIPDQLGYQLSNGFAMRSLIELPAGSGNLYLPLVTRPEARGFINAHVNCYCIRQSAATPSQ